MLSPEQLYEKLKPIRVGSPFCEFTREHCDRLYPTLQRIDQLKKEKNAVILAHNYVAPEILYGVADHTGDSYGLSKIARSSDADVIVFAAVRFMAETAKILNPDKTVIDPNPDGGCSLADGILEADVKRLRKEYPDHTFVCYINTTAGVKALCDVCVTSSNVYRVVERIDNDKIYFLPDKLMGQNLINHLRTKGINKTVDMWEGTCYVHEEYAPESIDQVRQNYPGVEILAHPECKEGVVGKADFVGSTTNMLDRVRESECDTFFLLTECGLTGVLESEFPKRKFVGTCTLCKYMKGNSLQAVERALADPLPGSIITLAPETREKALQCINRMFKFAE